MNMYYVGISNDPIYPGIISGPFDHKPGQLMPHYTLWIKTDRWVRVEW